jgi:CRP-like cAMP-binding protein
LRPVELPFDQTLYPADGTVEAVLFVESGMVSLLATLEDGEQVEVGIAGREGLIGLPLVLGDDRSLVEARVQMEGTALRIDAAALRDGIEGSAALRGLLHRYALAFQAQGDDDGGVQRAPRHRAAPRPLAADRPRPRRGGRVPDDARVQSP